MPSASGSNTPLFGGPPLFSVAALASAVSAPLTSASAPSGVAAPKARAGGTAPASTTLLAGPAPIDESVSQRHRSAIAVALGKIGSSFDPLFAARVGEAAGVFADESSAKKAKIAEDDEVDSQPVVEEEPESAPDLPQSLAEIHQLSTRNKSHQRKRKGGPALKQGSPLDYGKLASEAPESGTSAAEAIDIDSPSFVAKLGWGGDIAPTPSGARPVDEAGKQKKKRRHQTQKAFNDHTFSSK